MQVGVHVLPTFTKDTTDRNRTSPFAFTGNKFEFRMLGSTFSISEPNVVLNTAVADVLQEFADELEGAENFDKALHNLLQKTITEHKKIIFNGNNYSDEWIEEAEKRGLHNLKNTPDALAHYIADKNIRLFSKHGIYTETEMRSRYEILLENYTKILNIEALTMVDMVKKDIIPAVSEYSKTLADAALSKKSLDASINIEAETDLIKKLSSLLNDVSKDTKELEKSLSDAKALKDDIVKYADYYHDNVLSCMNTVRKSVDEMEENTASDFWPFPTYSELLFSV